MSIPPQPWVLRSEIVKGYQRGGSQLGFPTANLQLNEQITTFLKRHLNTVWCGFCVVEGDDIVEGEDIDGLTKAFDVSEDIIQRLLPFTTSISTSAENSINKKTKINTKIYPTVLSVGTNPHFKNVALTVEPYIMHQFKEDFYGRTLRLIAIQQMRQMGAFTTLEALKRQIWDDCIIGSRILDSEQVGLKWRDCLMDPRVFSLPHPMTTNTSNNSNNNQNQKKEGTTTSEPFFKSFSSSTQGWQTCEETKSSAQL